eukprot:gb/GECH01001312.1/.p1 GENE.gb/GECH01001312.1/~~gb/GECH01001312.1/.p1  ORF type:complete len:334 (+),score=76.28 gb/GECH01001312.1/:1-1002(+)
MTRYSPGIAAQVTEAYNRVSKYAKRTPIVKSELWSQKTGHNVYLKLETLQVTGSFKVRGALNKVFSLDPQVRQRGVVCASGGNHGLGVSYAASVAGVPADVFLPSNTAESRIAAVRRAGGRVRVIDGAWDDANRVAQEHTAANHMTYVHPFDDDLVAAGQGTLAVEMLADLPTTPDVVVASIGGGGLLSGVGGYVRDRIPGCRIYGVETVGADSMNQSIRANTLVELDGITSVATSLGAKKVTERTFNYIQDLTDDLLAVEDSAAMDALLATLDGDKLLCEPASSCCLAALPSLLPSAAEEHPLNVVVVLCGANQAVSDLVPYIEQRQSKSQN